MAGGVVLQFDVWESPDASQLYFQELTGVYDLLTNTTGWGAPNDTIGVATSATLTVTSTYSTTPLVINLFATAPSYPTNNTQQVYTIPYTAITTGTQIPDGQYTFVYQVVTSTGYTYTQTLVKLFYAVCKCCVTQMCAAIDDFQCKCNEAKINEFNQASLLLKGLEYSALNGLTSTFANNLAILNSMCSSNPNVSGCTSCS